MRKLLFSTMLAGAALAVQPAAAAPVIDPNPTLGSTPCALTDISPTASACGGWYEGNLNGGSAEKKAQSATALNALLGTTYTGDTLSWLEGLEDLDGNIIDFVTPLFGQTVISMHVGGAVGEPNGIGYEGTAFFLFDAGNLPGGLDEIGFNRAGLSNARLYSTGSYIPGVPEPATWAMMILGFGAIGAGMRLRKQAVRVNYSMA